MMQNLKRKKPEEYAKGAIEELNTQLSNARTEARKEKLQERIDRWKAVLGIKKENANENKD